MAAIKQPTYRKIINRGYTPIQYHTRDGQHSCWIEKTGPKLLHVRFTDGRLRRVPKSEARYMKRIHKHGAPTPLEDGPSLREQLQRSRRAIEDGQERHTDGQD